MIANTLEESVSQHHLLAHKFNKIPDNASTVRRSRHTFLIVAVNLKKIKLN